jgi:hypothetical protein
MKRTTRQYIIVAIICIVIIGTAAIFTAIVITNQIKEEYETLLVEAYNDISINQREVYLAVENIIAGDIITEEKVKRQTVYSSQPQDSYITNNDIGTMSLIDIPIETHIMNSMVTESTVSSELREVEYQVININSNIVSNDTVDVRIFFPNGEDYVVLTKKVLRGYSGETSTCCVWLTEEEIIRTRNAIVDAYLYTGAFLYTSKYIEPNVQEATIVTYTPSVGAIELIQDNPNIIETATNDLSTLVRKALENRLAESLSKDVSSPQWDLEDDNIYQHYQEEGIDADEPRAITDSEESLDEASDEVNPDEEDEKPIITQGEETSEAVEQYFNLTEEEKGGIVNPKNGIAPETGRIPDEDVTNLLSSPDLGSAMPSEDVLIDDRYFMFKEDY